MFHRIDLADTAFGPDLWAFRGGGEGLSNGHCCGAGASDLAQFLGQLGLEPGAFDLLALMAILSLLEGGGGESGGFGDTLDPVRRGTPAPRAPCHGAPRPEGSIPARSLIPPDVDRARARALPGPHSPREVAARPNAPARTEAPRPLETPRAAEPTGVADRIIDRTAQFESGRRYDAWNPNDNGHGVSFGLIQFNQEVGTLPALVRRMAERNPQRFDEIFGPYARDMRNASYVRSADLNNPDLRARLQRAGREPEFQQVQRDLAREGYYQPAERLAARHGLGSERALAMLFDSNVQNGPGGTERFLREAARGGGSEREVLERFARLADRGRENGRRARILNDRSFSDAPLATGPAPAAPTQPQSNLRGAAPIGPGNRVLMIGDSHTVGTYGQEMDRLLRSTGATVSSYGSSGSSPSWWMRGTTTRSGFVGRHADGTVDRPADWRDPHATPRLRDLIARERPDTLVVSLGGNMRGMSPDQIRQQVREIGEVARENGVRLIWAGPPTRREDSGNRAAIDRFDATLRDAVAPYGSYIASSRYTEYSGADGIHYSGPRGNQIARDWARQVFGEIQGAPPAGI